MTVLSNQQILDRHGNSVIIWPFDAANVNTSSYDVTLGQFYYAERRPSWRRRIFNPVYNIWDFEDVKQLWDGAFEAMTLSWWHAKNPWRYRSTYPGIADEKVIFIPPKHTILAHTNEFIGGRVDVVAEMDGWPCLPITTMMQARSSYGRNFIEVCKCAGYGDVGYMNRWTMEITNNSRFYEIPLVVGRRIAQIVFMETGDLSDTSDYATTGKYQDSPDLAYLKANWRPDMMLPRLDKDRDIPIYARARCPHDVPWDVCPDCSH